MGVPTAIDAPAAHRLRPWATRRCAAALPTAATLDRMPTAFDHEDGREEAKTTASPRVTFLREATRPDTRSVAVYWCLVEQAITNLARLLSVTAERIRHHDDLTARIIDGVNDACGSPLMRGHGCIMHLGRVCPTGYPSA